MKLLCDQMLGSLAKWLRLLGFDTFYANAEIMDDELLDIARRDHRILITRDKELIQRAKKKNVEVIEITSIDLDQQLQRVLQHFQIKDSTILSRCTLCNSLLKEVEKKDVIGKIPEKVFEQHDRYWLCSTCNKIYWSGSHYQNIIEKIKSITKKGS